MLLNCPVGQLINITTLWRHQTVIKEREIKVDNFYQKTVNVMMIAILPIIARLPIDTGKSATLIISI